ncbi:hypothetical protein [Parapedobacter lycopersici]|uniref:hypothetical protein n=1 Tax=Parapedobacter lycopersici TaxID=1864939 RepID=UPI00214DE014|nr:hypothetical protein [Parapedobacter lycopersici]
MKSVRQAHFRYLTKKEAKNPLYTVAYFCRNVTGLAHWRRDIDRVIRISATNGIGLKPIDFANLHFCWQQLYQHIELIYVLKHVVRHWEIESESPHYTLTRYPRTAIIFDRTLFRGTYLEFDRLSRKEFDNIGLFIDKFFAFKSLQAWQRLMDKLLITLLSENRLGDYSKYDRQDSKIYRYLEKLTEVFFLIYATKAIAHIVAHHAADFLLDEPDDRPDGSTVSEGQQEKTSLTSEIPDERTHPPVERDGQPAGEARK